jgi:hypothetical protein
MQQLTLYKQSVKKVTVIYQLKLELFLCLEPSQDIWESEGIASHLPHSGTTER